MGISQRNSLFVLLAIVAPVWSAATPTNVIKDGMSVGANELRAPQFDNSVNSGSSVAVRHGGVLLAQVQQERASMIDGWPASPGAPTEITGVLIPYKGYYQLRDEATGVLVQVEGITNTKLVRGRVTVKGAIVPNTLGKAGATQVVRVASMQAAASTGTTAGRGVALSKDKRAPSSR